ncbi:MAG: sigma-70 family RNA polymerase sigma factor [Myxococcota bacterium]
MHGRLSALRLAGVALRAAAGDGRAFRSLFRALHPVVYGYLASRTGSRADAEDLTANVFARIVERLPSFDAKRGSPRAWALAIARNMLIDHLRVQRNHAPLPEVHEALADTTLSPEAGGDERLERVQAALQRYPAVVREMFALRYGDGLRTREIAVVLEMSEAAVKQRFSRVLRELRKRAEGGELEEEVVHAH